MNTSCKCTNTGRLCLALLLAVSVLFSSSSDLMAMDAKVNTHTHTHTNTNSAAASSGVTQHFQRMDISNEPTIQFGSNAPTIQFAPASRQRTIDLRTTKYDFKKDHERVIQDMEFVKKQNIEKTKKFDDQLKQDLIAIRKLDPSVPQTVSHYPIRYALKMLGAAVRTKVGIPTNFVNSTGVQFPSIVWTPSPDLSEFEGAQRLHRIAALLPLANDFFMFESNELKGMGSDSADELNNYLAANGFNIRLDQFPEGGVGAVSIMKLKWQWEGSASAYANRLWAEGKEYPAVTMDAEYYNTKANPIVRLGTRGKEMYVRDEHGRGATREVIDNIWMCYPDVPREGFNLLSYINQMRAYVAAHEKDNNPCTVTFPMVYIHDQPDISWLKGMIAFPSHKEITQAKAENFFGMDQFGGFAESAVALGMATGACGRRERDEIAINKPFIVWVDREIVMSPTDIRKVQQPIFAAYVPHACWKRPTR